MGAARRILMSKCKPAAKTRWLSLVAQHRCGCCGIALPEGYNHNTCEQCLGKLREYYARRKGLGKCVHCGKSLSSDKYVLCEACRAEAAARAAEWRKQSKDKYNQTQRSYYARRRAAHLCVRCGEPLPEGWTKALCQACADWQKMRRLSRKGV